MKPMRTGETQRAYVERVLRADGHVSAYGAMYELADEQGHKRGITRLAAIVETLRKAGWAIETRGGHGELATYVLTAAPVGEWRCSRCGTPAATEPTPLLGGMGEAYCLACRKSGLFTRKAAA